MMAALLIFGGCGERGEPVPNTSNVVSQPQGEEAPVFSEAAPTATPLAREVDVQELHAQRDGLDIYGVIYIPQNAGEKMPTVIFSHGFGGTHIVGTQYAQALARQGYVVYCFDFCGGSPSSQSDGSTLEMSLFTEQEDLEAVIAMVQGLSYVDSDNLFLMGTSQGGAASAITGAAHPQEIRGMVLLYPAFVMVDNANELFASAEEIPDSTYFLWMNVGRTYFEPLLNYDIYGAISAYERDVLILSAVLVPMTMSV